MNILCGMNIDLGSPEKFHYIEDEDDEEDQQYMENPIQDADSSFQINQNPGGNGISLRMIPMNKESDLRMATLSTEFSDSSQKMSQGQRQMLQYAEEKLRELENQRNALIAEVDNLTVTGQDKDRIIQSKEKEIDKINQVNKKVSISKLNLLLAIRLHSGVRD